MGLDMKVQEAWAQGVTGKGTVVTILDDGLEKDHPDLRRNYVTISLLTFLFLFWTGSQRLHCVFHVEIPLFAFNQRWIGADWTLAILSSAFGTDWGQRSRPI